MHKAHWTHEEEHFCQAPNVLGLQLLARQNSDASDPTIFVIIAVFCVKSWKTGQAMTPDHIQCTSGFND
jgi:hypothetical protein